MDFSVLVADLRDVAEKYKGKTTDSQVSTVVYVDMFTKILQRAERLISKYEDQIMMLWVALNQLATLYKDLAAGSARDQLSRFIFGMCARTVLNIQWPQLDEENSVRQNFCKTVESVHEILAGLGFSRFQLILDLMENHWTHPTLTQIMSGEEEEDIEDGLEYIQKQDPEILKLRIEIMMKENCEEFALNLCTWSLKHAQLKNDLKIKEHQIVIMYKQQLYEKMQEVCESIVCHDGIKVMAHLAKNPTNQSLCIRLAQIFLVQDWIKPDRNCCTQELLKLWIHHQYLDDKDEERFLESIWAVAKVSRSTEQIGVLIDGVRKECGDTFIQLYTELCKYAINIDKGNMEKELEKENLENVKERQFAIAKTCVRMAYMLKEYDFRIAKICGLTAFSLDTTFDSLNLVNRLYWTVKFTTATSDESKINPATLYEIERLLMPLRPNVLDPDFTWKKIIPLCKKYKTERDVLLKESSQYVPVLSDPAESVKYFKRGNASSASASSSNAADEDSLKKEFLKEPTAVDINRLLGHKFPRDVLKGKSMADFSMKDLDRTINDLKKSINEETEYRKKLQLERLPAGKKGEKKQKSPSVQKDPKDPSVKKERAKKVTKVMPQTVQKLSKMNTNANSQQSNIISSTSQWQRSQSLSDLSHFQSLQSGDRVTPPVAHRNVASPFSPPIAHHSSPSFRSPPIAHTNHPPSSPRNVISPQPVGANQLHSPPLFRQTSSSGQFSPGYTPVSSAGQKTNNVNVTSSTSKSANVRYSASDVLKQSLSNKIQSDILKKNPNLSGSVSSLNPQSVSSLGLQRQNSAPNLATTASGERRPYTLEYSTASSSPAECARIAQQIAQMHLKQRAEREKLESKKQRKPRQKKETPKTSLTSKSIPSRSQISELLSQTMKGNTQSTVERNVQNIIHIRNKILQAESANSLGSAASPATSNVLQQSANAYSHNTANLNSQNAPGVQGNNRFSGVSDQLSEVKSQKFYLTSASVIDKLKKDKTGVVNLSESKGFSVKPVFSMVVPRALTSPDNQEELVRRVTNMVKKATSSKESSVSSLTTSVSSTYHQSNVNQTAPITKPKTVELLSEEVSTPVPDHVLEFLKNRSKSEQNPQKNKQMSRTVVRSVSVTSVDHSRSSSSLQGVAQSPRGPATAARLPAQSTSSTAVCQAASDVPVMNNSVSQLTALTGIVLPQSQTSLNMLASVASSSVALTEQQIQNNVPVSFVNQSQVTTGNSVPTDGVMGAYNQPTQNLFHSMSQQSAVNQQPQRIPVLQPTIPQQQTIISQQPQTAATSGKPNPENRIRLPVTSEQSEQRFMHVFDQFGNKQIVNMTPQVQLVQTGLNDTGSMQINQAAQFQPMAGVQSSFQQQINQNSGVVNVESGFTSVIPTVTGIATNSTVNSGQFTNIQTQVQPEILAVSNTINAVTPQTVASTSRQQFNIVPELSPALVQQILTDLMKTGSQQDLSNSTPVSNFSRHISEKSTLPLQSHYKREIYVFPKSLGDRTVDDTKHLIQNNNTNDVAKTVLGTTRQIRSGKIYTTETKTVPGSTQSIESLSQNFPANPVQSVPARTTLQSNYQPVTVQNSSGPYNLNAMNKLTVSTSESAGQFFTPNYMTAAHTVTTRAVNPSTPVISARNLTTQPGLSNPPNSVPMTISQTSIADQFMQVSDLPDLPDLGRKEFGIDEILRTESSTDHSSQRSNSAEHSSGKESVLVKPVMPHQTKQEREDTNKSIVTGPPDKSKVTDSNQMVLKIESDQDMLKHVESLLTSGTSNALTKPQDIGKTKTVMHERKSEKPETLTKELGKSVDSRNKVQPILQNYNENKTYNNEQQAITMPQISAQKTSGQKEQTENRIVTCHSTFYNAARLAKEREEREREIKMKQEKACPVQNADKSTLHICGICSKVFDTIEKMKEHVKLNLCPSKTCTICKTVFQSLEQLRSHLKVPCKGAKEKKKDFEYTKIFVCSKCNFTSQNEKIGTKHVENCNVTNSPIKAKVTIWYKCHMCREVLHDKDLAYKHISRFCPQLKAVKAMQDVQKSMDRLKSKSETSYKDPKGFIQGCFLSENPKAENKSFDAEAEKERSAIESQKKLKQDSDKESLMDVSNTKLTTEIIGKEKSSKDLNDKQIYSKTETKESIDKGIDTNLISKCSTETASETADVSKKMFLEDPDTVMERKSDLGNKLEKLQSREIAESTLLVKKSSDCKDAGERNLDNKEEKRQRKSASDLRKSSRLQIPQRESRKQKLKSLRNVRHRTQVISEENDRKQTDSQTTSEEEPEINEATSACKLCLYSTKVDRSLARHYTQAHDFGFKIQKRRYRCKYCDVSFQSSSKIMIKGHMMKHADILLKQIAKSKHLNRAHPYLTPEKNENSVSASKLEYSPRRVDKVKRHMKARAARSKCAENLRKLVDIQNPSSGKEELENLGRTNSPLKENSSKVESPVVEKVKGRPRKYPVGEEPYLLDKNYYYKSGQYNQNHKDPLVKEMHKDKEVLAEVQTERNIRHSNMSRSRSNSIGSNTSMSDNVHNTRRSQAKAFVKQGECSEILENITVEEKSETIKDEGKPVTVFKISTRSQADKNKFVKPRNDPKEHSNTEKIVHKETNIKSQNVSSSSCIKNDGSKSSLQQVKKHPYVQEMTMMLKNVKSRNKQKFIQAASVKDVDIGRRSLRHRQNNSSSSSEVDASDSDSDLVRPMKERLRNRKESEHFNEESKSDAATQQIAENKTALKNVKSCNEQKQFVQAASVKNVDIGHRSLRRRQNNSSSNSEVDASESDSDPVTPMKERLRNRKESLELFNEESKSDEVSQQTAENKTTETNPQVKVGYELRKKTSLDLTDAVTEGKRHKNLTDAVADSKAHKEFTKDVRSRKKMKVEESQSLSHSLDDSKNDDSLEVKRTLRPRKSPAIEVDSEGDNEGSLDMQRTLRPRKSRAMEVDSEGDNENEGSLDRKRTLRRRRSPDIHEYSDADDDDSSENDSDIVIPMRKRLRRRSGIVDSKIQESNEKAQHHETRLNENHSKFKANAKRLNSESELSDDNLKVKPHRATSASKRRTLEIGSGNQTYTDSSKKEVRKAENDIVDIDSDSESNTSESDSGRATPIRERLRERKSLKEEEKKEFTQDDSPKEMNKTKALNTNIKKIPQETEELSKNDSELENTNFKRYALGDISKNHQKGKDDSFQGDFQASIDVIFDAVEKEFETLAAAVVTETDIVESEVSLKKSANEVSEVKTDNNKTGELEVQRKLNLSKNKKQQKIKAKKKLNDSIDECKKPQNINSLSVLVDPNDIPVSAKNHKGQDHADAKNEELKGNLPGSVVLETEDEFSFVKSSSSVPIDEKKKGSVNAGKGVEVSILRPENQQTENFGSEFLKFAQKRLMNEHASSSESESNLEMTTQIEVAHRTKRVKTDDGSLTLQEETVSDLPVVVSDSSSNFSANSNINSKSQTSEVAPNYADVFRAFAGVNTVDPSKKKTRVNQKAGFSDAKTDEQILNKYTPISKKSNFIGEFGSTSQAETDEQMPSKSKALSSQPSLNKKLGLTSESGTGRQTLSKNKPTESSKPLLKPKDGITLEAGSTDRQVLSKSISSSEQVKKKTGFEGAFEEFFRRTSGEVKKREPRQAIVTKSMPSSQDVVTKPMPSSQDVVTNQMPSSQEVVTKSMPSSQDVVTKPMPSSQDVVTKPMPSNQDVVTKPMPSSQDVVTKPMPSSSKDSDIKKTKLNETTKTLAFQESLLECNVHVNRLSNEEINKYKKAEGNQRQTKKILKQPVEIIILDSDEDSQDENYGDVVILDSEDNLTSSNENEEFTTNREEDLSLKDTQKTGLSPEKDLTESECQISEMDLLNEDTESHKTHTQAVSLIMPSEEMSVDNNQVTSQGNTYTEERSNSLQDDTKCNDTKQNESVSSEDDQCAATAENKERMFDNSTQHETKETDDLIEDSTVRNAEVLTRKEDISVEQQNKDNFSIVETADCKTNSITSENDTAVDEITVNKENTAEINITNESSLQEPISEVSSLIVENETAHLITADKMLPALSEVSATCETVANSISNNARLEDFVTDAAPDILEKPKAVEVIEPEHTLSAPVTAKKQEVSNILAEEVAIHAINTSPDIDGTAVLKENIPNENQKVESTEIETESVIKETIHKEKVIDDSVNQDSLEMTYSATENISCVSENDQFHIHKETLSTCEENSLDRVPSETLLDAVSSNNIDQTSLECGIDMRSDDLSNGTRSDAFIDAKKSSISDAVLSAYCTSDRVEIKDSEVETPNGPQSMETEFLTESLSSECHNDNEENEPKIEKKNEMKGQETSSSHNFDNEDIVPDQENLEKQDSEETSLNEVTEQNKDFSDIDLLVVPSEDISDVESKTSETSSKEHQHTDSEKVDSTSCYETYKIQIGERYSTTEEIPDFSSDASKNKSDMNTVYESFNTSKLEESNLAERQDGKPDFYSAESCERINEHVSDFGQGSAEDYRINEHVSEFGQDGAEDHSGFNIDESFRKENILDNKILEKEIVEKASKRDPGDDVEILSEEMNVETEENAEKQNQVVHWNSSNESEGTCSDNLTFSQITNYDGKKFIQTENDIDNYHSQEASIISKNNMTESLQELSEQIENIDDSLLDTENQDMKDDTENENISKTEDHIINFENEIIQITLQHDSESKCAEIMLDENLVPVRMAHDNENSERPMVADDKEETVDITNENQSIAVQLKLVPYSDDESESEKYDSASCDSDSKPFSKVIMSNPETNETKSQVDTAEMPMLDRLECPAISTLSEDKSENVTMPIRTAVLEKDATSSTSMEIVRKSEETNNMCTSELLPTVKEDADDANLTRNETTKQKLLLEHNRPVTQQDSSSSSGMVNTGNLESANNEGSLEIGTIVTENTDDANLLTNETTEQTLLLECEYLENVNNNDSSIAVRDTVENSTTTLGVCATLEASVSEIDQATHYLPLKDTLFEMIKEKDVIESENIEIYTSCKNDFHKTDSVEQLMLFEKEYEDKQVIELKREITQCDNYAEDLTAEELESESVCEVIAQTDIHELTGSIPVTEDSTKMNAVIPNSEEGLPDTIVQNPPNVSEFPGLQNPAVLNEQKYIEQDQTSLQTAEERYTFKLKTNIAEQVEVNCMIKSAVSDSENVLAEDFIEDGNDEIRGDNNKEEGSETTVSSVDNFIDSDSAQPYEEVMETELKHLSEKCQDVMDQVEEIEPVVDTGQDSEIASTDLGKKNQVTALVEDGEPFISITRTQECMSTISGDQTKLSAEDSCTEKIGEYPAEILEETLVSRNEPVNISEANESEELSVATSLATEQFKSSETNDKAQEVSLHKIEYFERRPKGQKEGLNPVVLKVRQNAELTAKFETAQNVSALDNVENIEIDQVDTIGKLQDNFVQSSEDKTGKLQDNLVQSSEDQTGKLQDNLVQSSEDRYGLKMGTSNQVLAFQSNRDEEGSETCNVLEVDNSMTETKREVQQFDTSHYTELEASAMLKSSKQDEGIFAQVAEIDVNSGKNDQIYHICESKSTDTKEMEESIDTYGANTQHKVNVFKEVDSSVQNTPKMIDTTDDKELPDLHENKEDNYETREENITQMKGSKKVESIQQACVNPEIQGSSIQEASKDRIVFDCQAGSTETLDTKTVIIRYGGESDFSQSDHFVSEQVKSQVHENLTAVVPESLADHSEFLGTNESHELRIPDKLNSYKAESPYGTQGGVILYDEHTTGQDNSSVIQTPPNITVVEESNHQTFGECQVLSLQVAEKGADYNSTNKMDIVKSNKEHLENDFMETPVANIGVMKTKVDIFQTAEEATLNFESMETVTETEKYHEESHQKERLECSDNENITEPAKTRSVLSLDDLGNKSHSKQEMTNVTTATNTNLNSIHQRQETVSDEGKRVEVDSKDMEATILPKQEMKATISSKQATPKGSDANVVQSGVSLSEDVVKTEGASAAPNISKHDEKRKDIGAKLSSKKSEECVLKKMNDSVAEESSIVEIKGRSSVMIKKKGSMANLLSSKAETVKLSKSEKKSISQAKITRSDIHKEEIIKSVEKHASKNVVTKAPINKQEPSVTTKSKLSKTPINKQEPSVTTKSKLSIKDTPLSANFEEVDKEEMEEFNKRTESVKKSLKKSKGKAYQSDFNFEVDDDVLSTCSNSSSGTSLSSHCVELDSLKVVAGTSRTVSPFSESDSCSSPQKNTVSTMTARIGGTKTYCNRSNVISKVFSDKVNKYITKANVIPTSSSQLGLVNNWINEVPDKNLLPSNSFSERKVSLPKIAAVTNQYSRFSLPLRDEPESPRSVSSESNSGAESVDLGTKDVEDQQLHPLRAFRKLHDEKSPFTWDLDGSKRRGYTGKEKSSIKCKNPASDSVETNTAKECLSFVQSGKRRQGSTETVDQQIKSDQKIKSDQEINDDRTNEEGRRRLRSPSASRQSVKASTGYNTASKSSCYKDDTSIKVGSDLSSNREVQRLSTKDKLIGNSTVASVHEQYLRASRRKSTDSADVVRKEKGDLINLTRAIVRTSTRPLTKPTATVSCVHENLPTDVDGSVIVSDSASKGVSESSRLAESVEADSLKEKSSTTRGVKRKSGHSEVESSSSVGLESGETAQKRHSIVDSVKSVTRSHDLSKIPLQSSSSDSISEPKAKQPKLVTYEVMKESEMACDKAIPCACQSDITSDFCEECKRKQKAAATKNIRVTYKQHKPAVRRLLHGGKVFEIQKGSITETDIASSSPNQTSRSRDISPQPGEPRKKTRLLNLNPADSPKKKKSKTVKSDESGELPETSLFVKTGDDLNKYIHATLKEIRKQRQQKQPVRYLQQPEKETEAAESKWKLTRKDRSEKYPYSFKRSRPIT